MANVASKCSALLKEAGLSDLVVTKNQSLYDERIDSYWSVSAALHPECMVLPKTVRNPI